MGGVSAGRRGAFRVLRSVERGRRLDRALDEVLPDLEPRERPWVHELTYGVARLHGRLDHLLDHHLHAGLESVSPLLADLLRMGSYQLLYMDGVPAYAAISETVEQAKEAAGPGAGGLVNAVLRSVQRSGEAPGIFPDAGEDPAGHLSTWGSHPRWLVDRWLERWSPTEVAELVRLDNERPELSIRPVGISVSEAQDRLARAGIASEPVVEGSGCLRIAGGGSPAEVLDAVPAVVQDPGAALVVTYAAPERQSVVADLCVAPGGKGLALASSASYLLAGDASKARLELLREGAERLESWIGGVGPVVARAEAPPVTEVDVVLLDVPCSGTGTLRRNPDARWRLEPDDPSRMAALQGRILDGAAPAVGPGGLLVYSTCTLEPEENEERVSAFLDAHDEFRLEPPETEGIADYVDGSGFLRVLPHETGYDGAFAARLRRTG